MSITYNPGVPAAPDNPSVDQPEMLINTKAIPALIGVDHVPFNVSGSGVVSGQHNHVTFGTGQSVPTLATTPPATQIYPQEFIGQNANYLETYTSANTSAGNQINGYLPFVKAMGQFALNVGPYPITFAPITTNTLSINVANITASDGLTYAVTFTTVLPSNTYYVFVSKKSPSFSIPAYAFYVYNVTPTGFTIYATSLGVGEIVEFMVI